MKKSILVVVALLLSLLYAHTLFAATDTWTQKRDFGGSARSSAVGFSIGSKGYIGTGAYSTSSSSATYTKDFWEYDPVANTWTQKADFGGGIRESAFGFSIGSKGYVGTGVYSSGGYGYFPRDFWEYDPVVNKWTRKRDFGGAARYTAVGFSIGNKGYVGTGYPVGVGSNFAKDFWEYDPVANTWTQKRDFGGTARNSAIGFSVGTKGYIGMGGNSSEGHCKDFWEYDPLTDAWTQKRDFGGQGGSQAVGFSIGNRGYVGTGLDSSGYTIKEFWEYDPSNDIWTQKRDFGGTVRYDAIGFSIGNKGYVGAGRIGYGSTETAYADFWEYDTSRESLYAIIQNCLVDSSNNYCNPGGIYEPINVTTVFRTPRSTIIDSEVIISPWYDGDWNNEIINSSDNGFNTVNKGTPLPSDKFEVISYVDELSPICGTQNLKSYFFTYTTRNTSAGYAVTIDRWIDYLKAITLDYGRRIDTLTIFSHATSGDVQMSGAFHMTEQTAPLLSRLKTENILAPNATILLFACEAGKGETGQRFVQALANATGAIVYANTQFTGNPDNPTLWERIYDFFTGQSGSNSDWTLDVVKYPNILHAYFTGAGIWKWDGTTWTQVTPNNPQLLVSSGENLYGSFAGGGIWKWDGSTWSQVTPSNPVLMVATSTTLYGSFTGGGIWKWDGSSWTQVTPNNPQLLVASVGNLYGSFAGNGIWMWNGTTWTQVTPNNPLQMVASGSNLYGSYAGGGVWKWDGSTWSQVTPNNPVSMVTSGSNLYGSFAGSGIWKWDGSTWSQVTPNNPVSMVTSGSNLYGSFVGGGIWKWDGSTWTQVTPNNPVSMVLGY